MRRRLAEKGGGGGSPPGNQKTQMITERERSATVKARVWRAALRSKRRIDRVGIVRQLIEKEREGRGRREEKRKKRGRDGGVP